MKNYIYILFFSFIALSCNREEYLDIQPSGRIIPSKIGDYRLLLDQVDQDGVAGNVISPGFANGYSNTDLASDDVRITAAVLSNFSTNSTPVRAFTWNENLYTQQQEDGDWTNLYGQIYAANIVINNIKNVTDGSEKEIRNLKAEALAHRAYAYFCLVNLYALHYGTTTDNSHPGIPLRLGIEIKGLKFPRATVKEVYDFILKDLTTALKDLPSTPEISIRPSKTGVSALLARIYLFMGEFEKAKNAANASLDISNTLTDYNILQVGFGNVLTFSENLENDTEVLWQKKSSNPYEFIVVSKEVVNLITLDDLRGSQFYSLDDYGIANGTDEKIYAIGLDREIRTIGPSVPEMLLTRAECNVMLNNVTEAVNDLNTLRLKRMKTNTYVPLSNTDKEQVLTLVKNERRIELLAKGIRFFDLKRYNIYDPIKVDITHLYDNKTYTLKANSKNWALPIALKYILQNSEIGENIRE